MQVVTTTAMPTATRQSHVAATSPVNATVMRPSYAVDEPCSPDGVRLSQLQQSASFASASAAHAASAGNCLANASSCCATVSSVEDEKPAACGAAMTSSSSSKTASRTMARLFSSLCAAARLPPHQEGALWLSHERVRATLARSVVGGAPRLHPLALAVAPCIQHRASESQTCEVAVTLRGCDLGTAV